MASIDDYYYYEDLTTANTILDNNDWSPDEKYNANYDLYNYDEIVQKMAITLYSIVFALGIIGNGLVIWIAGFRMKNTINAMWFLHLAIADFLCSASLPLRIADWAVYFSYRLDFGYCLVNMFLFNINISTCVLLLTAMSIDRWVSVMWPFWAKAHRTCNVVRISAAIIWGLSLIVAGLGYYMYRYRVGDLSEWCLYKYILDCYNPKLDHNIQQIRLVILCVIPFLIIFSCYVTIFYKIRKSKRFQRSQRSSRIITAVVSCFFICWFPYYIWPLTNWYSQNSFSVLIVNTIITSLAFLNSCMNPIIYVFMGLDFQQDLFRSIPSILERALGEHPNDLRREEDTGNTHTADV
ncbi:formyl peptide receptor-related sequence 1-like [Anomaloglossus baeobatrachus]|uniref:formyl peptide receptor-related sequence 1-like n=1 Tax=Anomaloglossus baeobatrachus TaxID=238106 RepID=UPI003F5000A1